MIKLAVRVKKRDNETVDEILARFKRNVNRSNILADVRKHEFYLKPGVRKRMRIAENAKNKKKKR